LNSSIKCFILIEPGLGYIIPVLQEKYTNSKIIVLHVESKNLQNEQIPVLCSTDTTEVERFLEENLKDFNINEVHIIEWRPSLNFYKDAYVKLLSQVVDFIKRADAEERTTFAFGKKWINNFFRNLKIINKNLLYRQSEIPVIVIGSGPGLEKALPLIKDVQDSCLIIAASSSVLAVSSAGITADVIIATDGGSWALKHLYPCCRAGSQPQVGSTLAVNLCAALPSQCSAFPILIINDGSLWQSIIFHELKLPSVIIPQRGTVTATALELAMILSSSYIYLAGMDFSAHDIKTHVRPYAFDSLFFGKANRFFPFYSESFTRASLIRSGGSMEIYAAWFRNQLTQWTRNIFSIDNTNKIFNHGVPSKSGTKIKKDIFKVLDIKKEENDFCKRGISALINALDNDQYALNLKQELIPLLFAGKKNVSKQELKNALQEIA
jgi:hypothetical protein